MTSTAHSSLLTPNRFDLRTFGPLSVELGHARFDSDEEAEEGTAESGSPSVKKRLRRRPLKRNQLQAKGSVVSEGNYRTARHGAFGRGCRRRRHFAIF